MAECLELEEGSWGLGGRMGLMGARLGKVCQGEEDKHESGAIGCS